MVPEPEDIYSDYLCADLYDEAGNRVMSQTECSPEELAKELQIKSVYDIGAMK